MGLFSVDHVRTDWSYEWGTREIYFLSRQLIDDKTHPRIFEKEKKMILYLQKAQFLI